MHMRWFEKEFSNMRFAIGWGNSQTWDGLILDRETLNIKDSLDAFLLDERILSMRCLCDALLLDEGLFKHKALCYWMSKLTNIRYFAIRCRNSQTCFTVVWGTSQVWYYPILDEEISNLIYCRIGWGNSQTRDVHEMLY